MTTEILEFETVNGASNEAPLTIEFNGATVTTNPEPKAEVIDTPAVIEPAEDNQKLVNIAINGTEITFNPRRLLDQRFFYTLGKLQASKNSPEKAMMYQARMLDLLFPGDEAYDVMTALAGDDILTEDVFSDFLQELFKQADVKN